MDENNYRVNNFPFKEINPYIFTIIIVVTVFFTYQLLGSLFALIIFGGKFLEMSNMFPVRLTTIISQFLLILFPVYLLNYLRGNDLASGFSIRKASFLFYLLSGIAIIVVQPVLQFYMLLQKKAIEKLPIDSRIIDAIKSISEQLDSYTAKLVSAGSLEELFLVIIAIAVTPAICEELMFRGLILNTLIKSGNIKLSIFLTGFIFSLFHFHPFNLIPLIFLGVFLSVITYYSRSIFPAIFTHFLNNLFSVLAVHFYGKEVISNYEYFENNFFSTALFASLSFILFVFITYYIIKEGKKNLVNG